MRWALEVGRTPRELLACVTSEDITEMMAFERIEPFGGLAAQFMAGQIAATVANVQRGKDDPPYSPDFFMPALRLAMQPPAVVADTLDDEAHADLLDAILFGRAPQ